MLMYRYYGDREVLENYYKETKNWVEFIESTTGKEMNDNINESIIYLLSLIDIFLSSSAR